MRIAILLVSLLLLPFTVWGQQADNYPPDVTTVELPPLVSSSLPVVRITTGRQVIARNTDIKANFAIEGKGLLADIKETGCLRYYGWTAFTNSDKKAYHITLPTVGNLILQAPFSDRSLVRSLLLSLIVRTMGMQMQQPQLCEVVMDNVYYGVYLLLPSSATLSSTGNEAAFFLAAELAHFIDGYRYDDLTDGGLAFGNCDAYEAYRTDTWAYASNGILQAQVAPKLIPEKWESLLNDDQFRRLVKDKWQSLRDGVLGNQALTDSLDSLLGILTTSGAASRNHQAWPRWGKPLWPNFIVAMSYNDEVDTLKVWLKRRLEWMDEHIGQLGVEQKKPIRHCTPLSIISGFNTDCIAESESVAPRDRDSHPALDGHGSVFTTSSVGGNTRAIPDDGILLNSDLKFQLGDFAGNNCLYLSKSGESGTLTFSTACRADSIALLVVGTNRGDNYNLSYNVVLHYADGTAVNAGTFTTNDWADGGDFSFYRWRADNNDGALETLSAYSMTVQLLPCDKSLELTSVMVSSNCQNDTWGYGMVSVFAVTAINQVTSGISPSRSSAMAKPVIIYDAAGVRRNRISKGLYILKYDDGRVVKIIK
ncbi:MAG: CotH kinase family protein [Prevotella sp.]|nr:CotH kinase family protein [Prevotella sp.]